jgi:predicted anti-sigma-YlaC factor YlaD
MRHLTLEELLALREGEQLVDLARHLRECPACSIQDLAIERRREQLRALPLAQPQSDPWPAIRARIVASRRRRVFVLGGALAAAGIAFAMVVLTMFQGRARSGTARLDEVATLVRRSQLLEEKLHSIPEPEILYVGSADAIVQLEDQIALIDQCIGEVATNPESDRQLSVLWQTRITLLETLTNLRNPVFAQLLR